MDEIRFETEFLNDYFRKILGKETFTMTELKRLKGIVITGNKEKITQHDFDILQKLEDGIELERINLSDLNVKFATIQYTEEDSDEKEDLEKVNNVPFNYLFFPSLRGLTLEFLDKLSDRFKYFVAGDALAYKGHYYTYYTKQEIKIILSKLEEIKSLIPENANDVTKFMTVYKWIGIHADYNFSAMDTELLNNYSHQESRKEIMRIARSLLGVLIEGEAVCEGYSWALETCLDYIGMTTRVVGGKSASGCPHAWIQVKIDDIWYNACLTSDYRDIRLQRPLEFCLRSDAYFKENGAVFESYRVDINEKNEDIPLEVCASDYPRDSKGNLLYDNSSFVDEYYKDALTHYQLARKSLENEELKMNLDTVEKEERGRHL